MVRKLRSSVYGKITEKLAGLKGNQGTESFCHGHSIYSRFFTGRPGDPVSEEPRKYTHFVDLMVGGIDGPQEYEIRLFEGQQFSTAMREGLWGKEKLSEVMTYLSFPPIFVTRLELDPAAEILLFGRSVDVTFVDTYGR